MTWACSGVITGVGRGNLVGVDCVPTSGGSCVLSVPGVSIDGRIVPGEVAEGGNGSSCPAICPTTRRGDKHRAMSTVTERIGLRLCIITSRALKQNQDATYGCSFDAAKIARSCSHLCRSAACHLRRGTIMKPTADPSAT